MCQITINFCYMDSTHKKHIIGYDVKSLLDQIIILVKM